MNYREEQQIYEIDTTALTELLKAARQIVEQNLKARQGLRYVFARRDIQAELQKYNRVIEALGRITLGQLHVHKLLIDNLTKPEPLDEQAWLGYLQASAQIKFMDTDHGHMFLQNPDPATLQIVREELEKTPLGRKAIETLERNNIQVLFAPPLQDKNDIVYGTYMRGLSKLWLAYSGTQDMAAVAVHEATHVAQDKRHPDIFQYHNPQSRQQLEQKVSGYIAWCLTEAQAYAAENLYNAEKLGLYPHGSQDRAEWQKTASEIGYQDNDEDFRKFLYHVYFMRNLQSITQKITSESEFVDSYVTFYSQYDFEVCLKQSPSARLAFMERVCVDANGECFLPPAQKAREDTYHNIITLMSNPPVMNSPRMCAIPGTYKPS